MINILILIEKTHFVLTQDRENQTFNNQDIVNIISEND